MTAIPAADPEAARSAADYPPVKYRTILLFGAPGAGKGTMGKSLGAIPGFVHCACGDNSYCHCRPAASVICSLAISDQLPVRARVAESLADSITHPPS